MVSRGGARPHAGVVVGGLAVLSLALAIGGLTALDSADASSPVPSRVATALPAAAGQLGAAAGDAALGLRTPYYEPAATADPDEPGATIDSGADQPDPFMVVRGSRHYLFASQDIPFANVPVRSGTVVGRWGPVTDALPDLPAWAVPGWTWAPDVHRFGSHYMLYFTARLAGVSPATMCIGDAISTAVGGPYLPAATPFICQQDQGGSIDPRTFVDADGTPYMIWKSDENARSDTADTSIYSQLLRPDGEALLGQPVRIFGPDEPWQGHIVEAPQLMLVRGIYSLFYSGGWFNQTGYAIGVARCAGPAGPCIDTTPVPLLASNAQGQGPGEESVFTDASGAWLLYTPFRSTLPLPGPPRPVAMARLGFGPGGPYLAAPGTVISDG